MTLPFRPFIALALVCIAALPCNPAAAQGTIQGRVTDKTGGRIPGAEIRVVGREYHRTVVTDVQGVYRLSDIPRGTYSVRTKMNGFRAARRDNVRVAAGRTVEVNFTLTVAGPVHVKKVEVTAARR